MIYYLIAQINNNNRNIMNSNPYDLYFPYEDMNSDQFGHSSYLSQFASTMYGLPHKKVPDDTIFDNHNKELYSIEQRHLHMFDIDYNNPKAYTIDQRITIGGNYHSTNSVKVIDDIIETKLCIKLDNLCRKLIRQINNCSFITTRKKSRIEINKKNKINSGKNQIIKLKDDHYDMLTFFDRDIYENNEYNFSNDSIANDLFLFDDVKKVIEFHTSNNGLIFLPEYNLSIPNIDKMDFITKDNFQYIFEIFFYYGSIIGNKLEPRYGDIPKALHKLNESINKHNILCFFKKFDNYTQHLLKGDSIFKYCAWHIDSIFSQSNKEKFIKYITHPSLKQNGTILLPLYNSYSDNFVMDIDVNKKTKYLAKKSKLINQYKNNSKNSKNSNNKFSKNSYNKKYKRAF